MESIKDVIVSISEGNFSNDQLVSILLLIVENIEIDTISETARKEGKTPRGIEISNQYRKIKIGKQKFAITGLKEDMFKF